MTPLEVILAKKAHLARLANQSGAAGEQDTILAMERWVPRPKGQSLRILIEELATTGIVIKASSFDALALPAPFDISDRTQLRAHLNEITFIEIKTANQSRVQPGFKGFFFALTESEIAAAEQLGSRHRVALFNNSTGELLITSVPEIISRAKSMNWQLSVQL
ncbi:MULTISPECIES: hypothetical protein [unclassified Bradyrhizobium]|uniref:hypothetical protein n=1 Tax=unclassified Bradyrhizobium TaxID=2631580 RepID=UPI00291702ED|nr:MULTISPECIES: hypothetical protein [unclassified Bradyrhizobium]